MGEGVGTHVECDLMPPLPPGWALHRGSSGVSHTAEGAIARQNVGGVGSDARRDCDASRIGAFVAP